MTKNCNPTSKWSSLTVTHGYSRALGLPPLSHPLVLGIQNIDGLHTAAGSRQVVELHGSLWETRCVRCRRVQRNRDMPICEALEGRVSGCCSMSLHVIRIKCTQDGWYTVCEVQPRADQ